MNQSPLLVNEESCTECESCSLICSIEKTGLTNPKLARVRVVKRWPQPPQLQICRQIDCQGTPCVEACPTEGLYVSGREVVLKEEECTGCLVCVEACPYQAIWFDQERSVPYKCDLCGGAPRCIEYCFVDALLWQDGGENG
ncbi:MAG: 4Fe-4S dicluster domain-containing protein [Anaerolineae bacterium]